MAQVVDLFASSPVWQLVSPVVPVGSAPGSLPPPGTRSALVHVCSTMNRTTTPIVPSPILPPPPLGIGSRIPPPPSPPPRPPPPPRFSTWLVSIRAFGLKRIHRHLSLVQTS